MSSASTIQTCKYSNGSCGNPRAIKRNGQPHTLCQMHRELACTSQRRVDANKRKLRIKQRQAKITVVRSKETAKAPTKSINQNMELVKSLESELPTSPEVSEFMADISDCSSLTDFLSDDEMYPLSLPGSPLYFPENECSDLFDSDSVGHLLNCLDY